MKDLVSIIVPIYGVEAYLPACIESICNQSYTNLQIILVDDQSPDRCPAICDSYAEIDKRITVIHQENKGVSGARNTGMKYAVGDYIMFVDSDDELLPDAVNVLLKEAYKYGADIVSANAQVVDKKVNICNASEDKSSIVYSNDESLLLSLNGSITLEAVWAKLFRSAFIRGIAFEEGYNINEDVFFLFKCCMKKPKFVQHNAYVYRYHILQGSCSRQTFSDKYFSMLYFCNRKKELVEENCSRYMEQAYNMEVRTHLQFLDVLCRTNDKKYKDTYKESVQTVRRLRRYHKPINDHHKKLAWIVANGFYPLYKKAIRFKYYR